MQNGMKCKSCQFLSKELSLRTVCTKCALHSKLLLLEINEYLMKLINGCKCRPKVVIFC